jgi:hypothetical protein
MGSPRSKKERRKSQGPLASLGPIISELIEPYLEIFDEQIELDISQSRSGPDQEALDNTIHNLTLLAIGAILLRCLNRMDAAFARK